MAKLPTPQELIASRPEFPSEPWLDIKPQFAPGSFCYPAKKETMELLHMPIPTIGIRRPKNWNLPKTGKQILCDAFEERLQKHRSLKLFHGHSVCAAAPAPTNATSSSAPTIRRTCRCCARNCSVPCTAATSPPPGVSSARLRRPQADHRRHQGMVHLLLPVHRMPPLLPVLPLRHRHRRDHGHRA